MMGCVYKISKNTDDETEVIKARFLTTKKAYSSLKTIFRSQKMYQNNKIRFHAILTKPILYYGSVTWTLTHDRTNAAYIRKDCIMKNLWPNTRKRTLASQMQQ